MGRRLNQLPVKSSLASGDYLVGHDSASGFRIAQEDLSIGGGGGGSNPDYEARISALEAEIVAGAVLPSFVMSCASTSTNHRVSVINAPGIGFYLYVNPTPEAVDAVSGITMTTGSENVLVTLVKDGPAFRFNFDQV